MRCLGWVLVSALGCIVGACSAPASGSGSAAVEIAVPPPMPRHERVLDRHGYVWEPGYYRWDASDRRHVWVDGHFTPARPGQHWVPAMWRKESNGLWRFEQGHWRPG
ncbi:MAG: YXWGXW repeat-containing protein [Proteobacteria bacterium]|nr:YXWGXW repeat-containing protein [Pseudomonadota bacterium]